MSAQDFLVSYILNVALDLEFLSDYTCLFIYKFDPKAFASDDAVDKWMPKEEFDPPLKIVA